MKSSDNPQLQLAYDFVQYTDQNIFLTGKAGTGKTTFLLNLKHRLNKRMIVVAPTGVAAINAGGVTIHSFFQLPFGPYVPDGAQAQDHPEAGREAYNQAITNKFNREKINIIRSLDLLVIDEISMVRADMLDAIDDVLRRFRDRYKPFGGVQLLMIGDLQQLPPVVKQEEWEILRDYYATPFFFGSLALRKTSYVPIELKQIFRQSDDAFIEILNKVRDNRIDVETLNKLNKRYIPNFANNAEDGYITLTSHIAQAQRINETRMEKLPGSVHYFDAVIGGEFPEYSYPTDRELVLKVGAQVMFIKNDISHEKKFYNGKIGKIVGFDDEHIKVKCPQDEKPISVEPLEWSNNKYSIDPETREIKESTIGTFTQYPLKLAWAITIHKSQGLTFEKAIIDANAAFAHGQVYVALSRCKTLDGIILNTPISTGCIKTDHTVSAFTHEAEQNQPDQELLARSKQAFQQKLHAELFDFTVLGRRMQYLIKILNEHKASFLDSYRESFDNMSDLLKSDLLSVANKFAVQIKQLSDDQISIEENVTLQERTRKGCAYFLEKTNALMHLVLKNTPVETDNKVVRKSVNDALEKLRQEANIKLSCLKTCLKGFIVMEYLDARAKATIEKPEIRKPALKKEDYAAISNIHPQLYKRLRKWRNSKAEEANLPEYMIMPQKTLMELVKRLPESRYELQNVKGFGKSKTLQFGTEVLEIVKTYMIDNHIGSSNGIPEPSDANESVAPDDTIEQEEGTSKPKAEIKKKKADTKLLSFDLFKSGATVEEIARERGLTVSTIDGHLSHYVRTGELEIGMVVPQEKIALITEYYINNPNSGMTAAKESLDETISYSDIRYVLKHLEHLKQGDAELPE